MKQEIDDQVALEYYEDALRWTQDLYGKDGEETLEIWHRIAIIKQNFKEFTEAEEIHSHYSHNIEKQVW